MEKAIFGTPPAAVDDSWSGVASFRSTLTGDGAFWVTLLLPWEMEALVADCGLIPTGCTKVTLYDWRVSCMDPLILSATASSQAYPCSAMPRTFGENIIELAAGSGAMGLGALFMGARIRVCIESCNYAVEHLKHNEHGFIIHDDIGSLAAIRSAHEVLNGLPTTGFFGSPLQSLIVECVPMACATVAVQEALELVCGAMGREKIDLMLDLKLQWPMRRARWWGILAPPIWLAGPFHGWATDPRFPTTGALLKSWPAYLPGRRIWH